MLLVVNVVGSFTQDKDIVATLHAILNASQMTDTERAVAEEQRP